jgi:hypothetical protein
MDTEIKKVTNAQGEVEYIALIDGQEQGRASTRFEAELIIDNALSAVFS